MLQNLEAFGFPVVTRARSKAHLQELLASDYRGLIVTTMHKFDGMPANVCERRNVVILIDEAHRSQEGDLGIYMRAALPHSFQFGFTGTPIDKGKVGQGTFEMFGQVRPGGLSRQVQHQREHRRQDDCSPVITRLRRPPSGLTSSSWKVNSARYSRIL